MIPIGTRCIVVGGTERPYWIGKECTVVAHGYDGRDAYITWAAEAHQVEFTDGTDARARKFVRRRHLIPIGHNPDVDELVLDVEFPAGIEHA